MKKRRMNNHSSLGTRVLSIAAALALCGSMVSAPALAYAATDSLAESLAESGLHTDYIAEESLSLLSESTPAAFDLRHFDGLATYDADKGCTIITGGTNYVSPVKNQSPFGSCWAFSIVAASETSMLTSLDKEDDGELNGSVNYEKAAAGECGDIAAFATDLSERHLAYFAYGSPSNLYYPNQSGEGDFLASGNTDAASVLDAGGMPFMGVSIYGSGIGPYNESVAPYVSDENNVTVFSLDESGTHRIDVSGSSLTEAWEKAVAYTEEYWTDEKLQELVDYFQQRGKTYTAEYLKGQVIPTVSKSGTWSVNSDYMFGSIAELTNSNIIDSTKDEATGSLTQTTISQMKQELLEGNPLSIGFKADQSLPGEQVNVNHSYLNTETWAQYTYEAQAINHAVTIVGYDDNYSATNFTHTIYKTDPATGQLVVDEETTNMTTPAGDGAWIVKNSWGCEDAENEWNQKNWGVDGSGYFYLSYYDKTIDNVESYEFDLSEEAQERTGYALAQYDLTRSSNISSKSFASEYKMVNVFDGDSSDDTMYGLIRDLGCMTGVANDTVTLEIYVMNNDDDPTEVISEGKPAATFTEKFEHAGFHRVHLASPVLVSGDKKVAVVQTTVRPDGTYEQTYVYGTSKQFTDAYNEALSPLGKTAVSKYTVAVVNEGESLECKDGAWTDWAEARKGYDSAATQSAVIGIRESAAQQTAQANALRTRAAMYRAAADKATDQATKARYESAAAQCEQQAAVFEQTASNLTSFSCDSMLAIDNWSIKVYADVLYTEVEAPVAADGLVYNGKSQAGVVAAEGYTVSGGSATDAGDYLATATLAEGYCWSDGSVEPKQISWSIAKAKQTISVSKVIAATNYNGTLSRLVAPLKSVAAKGELTYSKVSGNAGLTVVKSGADAGKVKVAAKMAVGTYSVTIRVKAAATDNYEAATRDVAVSVKVSRFTPTISITGKVVRAVNYSKTKDKTVACPITKIQCASKPMTYELSSAKDAGGAKVTSKFAVDAATGAVTVKAGTAKGAYTVNIKVMSDDNENYRGNYKVVPCTVKVV